MTSAAVAAMIGMILLAARTMPSAMVVSMGQCQPVVEPVPCDDGEAYSASLPNLYGHYTANEAMNELRSVMDSLSSSPPLIVRQFLCTLYLPPCLTSNGQKPQENLKFGASLHLPCRPLCELARAEAAAQRIKKQQVGPTTGEWPVNLPACHNFPTEKCFALAGPGEVRFVEKSLVASGTGARLHDVIPKSVAPLESELGEDDDNDLFDVQVVTLATNHIPPRRYDLADLGDPEYFQGWADVQGTGAANDYCRMIGKGKRRFLACALAGSRGQDHQYVSKLGFDPGHPDTWFMRDVDSDGRDDYCRCLGDGGRSRVVCMKAGELGFYGSTMQGGSENTFELPDSQTCHHKRFNPHFGL